MPLKIYLFNMNIRAIYNHIVNIIILMPRLHYDATASPP